jgi:hypothetical protein
MPLMELPGEDCPGARSNQAMIGKPVTLTTLILSKEQ